MSSMIASNRFVSLAEHGDSLCEVTVDECPCSCWVLILQLAKLRMLQFYCDCIDCFVDQRDFQYVEMYIDSAYLALCSFRDHSQAGKREGVLGTVWYVVS